ncbi:MAG: sporulation protein [Ruminococcus sp.]|nr:sporulation protein [Ruminococcus sp.]
MNTENPFKKAAAVLAGVMMLCGTPATGAAAAETTSASEVTTTSTTETQAETTAAADADAEDTSEADTTSDAQEETTASAEEEKAEEKEIEWYKAELDEYDDSLSLVSYEVSPESTKDGKTIAKSGKSTKKTKEPTPVELDVTGGYVGDIPWFESEPEIDAKPGQFAIVTYGWGHGVGMSQNGANFYAQYSGWTYQDILFHYYPDTYLMNTGTAEDETITVAGVEGDVLSMVSQIVFNEVGSSMSYEAIKAQAVAVYTYCKYNGNDSSDLRCKPYPPQVVVDACEEVLGQALYYDDDFALTMFSASSGGVTANCNEVFWSNPPYLRSVSSDYDAAYDPHYGTVTYIDDFQLRNMIEGAYGIKLSDDPDKWIQPTYSDETGYVTYVNIDNQRTVKGYEFKLAIGLKSSKFNVYYTPRPEGEEIPDGSSTPKVVDPDYEQTPAIIYSNNQPTTIAGGNVQNTTDPEAMYEEPEETIENWTDPATETLTDPTTETWTEPTTEPDQTWTDPTTETGTEQTWTEPDYSGDTSQTWTDPTAYTDSSQQTWYDDTSYSDSQW